MIELSALNLKKRSVQIPNEKDKEDEELMEKAKAEKMWVYLKPLADALYKKNTVELVLSKLKEKKQKIIYENYLYRDFIPNKELKKDFPNTRTRNNVKALLKERNFRELASKGGSGIQGYWCNTPFFSEEIREKIPEFANTLLHSVIDILNGLVTLETAKRSGLKEEKCNFRKALVKAGFPDGEAIIIVEMFKQAFTKCGEPNKFDKSYNKIK